MTSTAFRVVPILVLSSAGMWLQGCGGGGSGGSGGSGVSGTIRPGINLYTGTYSGDAIPAAQLPSVEDYGTTDFQNMMAFSAEEAATDLSSSLGIDISGTKNAFSGSAALQRTRQMLDSTSSLQVHGEVMATVIKQRSTISAASMLSAIPALGPAVKALPNSPNSTSDDNLKKFATFFNVHGSHFLSTVYLGGQLYSSFDADVKSSDVTNELKRSFKLGALGQFAKDVKLPIGISGQLNYTDDDLKTFQSLTSSSREVLRTLGGESGLLTWDAWSGTVKEGHMVPIKHEYSSMKAIIQEMQSGQRWTDDEVNARMAALENSLKTILGACPNSCSSQGLCDWESKSCSCDPRFSGPDCSVEACANDCGDHGTCDTTQGECKCDDGWKGDDCSTKDCGQYQLCNGQCIDPDANCCADGHWCSAKSSCCGSQCCDLCAAGDRGTCSPGKPHCCCSESVCCPTPSGGSPCNPGFGPIPFCHCQGTVQLNSTPQFSV